MLGLILLLPLVTCSPVCYYEKTAGHALYGHNNFVLNHVSLAECREACTGKGQQCNSFDYNYETDSCFMSDQTKVTEPELFGTHRQLDYFEKVCIVENTLLWKIPLYLKPYSQLCSLLGV